MHKKLVKIGENKQAWTTIHSLEGSNRFILEFVAFGYAYKSRYILLKSTLTVDRLNKNDEKVLAQIRNGGSGLGKIIKDSQLVYNDTERCMYIDIE